jgi:beta-glucosidase
VHPGQTATVALVLNTSGSQPLDRNVSVNYQSGATLIAGNGAAARPLPSTASPGQDYQPASGSVTFPAGSASGTTRSFR